MRALVPSAVLLALGAVAPVSGQNCPDPDRLAEGTTGAMAHVRHLADDDLEGRAVGTSGARCAAAYLAARFHALGLDPAGHEGSYFHTFPVRAGAELGPDNTFTVEGERLALGQDWAPYGFSASRAVEAPLVYGGHGLSSPGTARDRFSRISISGKVVVVEAGDPDAPGASSLRADPRFKATVAAGRGAAGMLILLPEGLALPNVTDETRDALPIPIAAIGGATAARVRAAARQDHVGELRTDVRPLPVDAQNVVARLPGTDPEHASEHIIVGAHYDHLGFGGEGSLEPGSRAVHNGADDNASGTAAVLEIARALVDGPPRPRSVLFIAFTGEERGLWGSARFVTDPTIDLERSVAMLNLDMVGRLEDGPLTVLGVGTASRWPTLLDEVNDALAEPHRIVKRASGSGLSDHASFHAEGIPVLHFFTGTHEDYHRPSDDWEKVDGDGLDRIVTFVSCVVERLARPR